MRPGQIWADKDPREKGRKLKVLGIDVESMKALCSVVRDADHMPADRSLVGRETKIKLSRFKTGYRPDDQVPC